MINKNKITLEDIMAGYPEEAWYTKIYDFFVYTIPFTFNDFTFEIKMKYQLLTKGYNDRQVWGFKTEMAELTIKLLTELKDRKVGSPSQLTQKKWTKILEMIIDGFEAQLELETSWRLTPKQIKKVEDRWKIGMVLYTEWFGHLWD